LRVLILEDVPVDAELMERELRKGGIKFSSKRVDTKKAFLKELIEFEPDLILGDYKLPSFDGLSALGIVLEKCPDVPFLFISGTIGEELAIETLKTGATDYVLKNRLSRLVPAVNRALKEVEERNKRKRAEETLRQSEATLRALINAPTDSVLLLDTRGVILDLNEIAAERLGKSRDELIGTLADDSLPEDIAKRRRSVISQIFETSREVRFEDERDGIWYDTVVHPITDKNGEVRRLAIIARDITERKRAEEVLKKEKDSAQKYLDIAGVMLLAIDADQKVILINRKGCEILGYKEEDIIGRNWFDHFIPERDRKSVKAVFTKLVASEIGPVEYFENSVLTKSGMEKIIAWHNTIIRGENDHIMGTLSSGEDVTERKKVEEALKESEKKYRQVVENATEIIYTVDERGNFTYANPTGLKVTGYPLEELRGFNYMDLVVPEHRERVTKIYFNQLRQRIPTTHVEFPFFNKGGGIIWFSQNSTLVMDEDKIVGFHIIARDITERKRAEEALRESEERYRTLVETSPDAITLLDLNLNIIMANRPALALYGYESPEEVVGQSALNFIAPEDRPRAVEDVRKMLETGSIGTLEYTLLRKGGIPFSAKLRASMIVNVEKKPLAYICISRDITDRKKAEETLKKSEERFKELYDDAPIGYFEYNTDGCITSVNRTELEMLGYSVEEMVGQPPWKFVVEEDIARQRILDVLAGIMPPARGLERTFRRKDGTTFPALIQDRLFQDAEGKILGIRGTIQDITDRKRIEVSLRKSEQTYRTLVESSTDAILMLDTERNIVACNQSFLNLLGYERGEVVGGSIRVVHPSDESFRSFGKTVYSMIERSGFFKGEWEFKRKDNVIFSAETVTSAIKSAEGSTTGYIAILRDLTDRKRAEEEKVALVDQLRQSQKMEAIGRLAGGVAHDFNNLLTVIKGYCQLSLVEMKEGNPLREAFEVINKATEKAADLTRQLLAFSRRQIMEMKVLDLNDLFRNLDKMLRRVIGEDIELVTILDENLGRVKTDTGQIEQVIMNLVVNARDAMPKGGKLTIETANVDLDGAYARTHVAVKPGPYVMLAVSDTGVGMTPEVKERVFEPFFTTKDKGKGTGLGLSTVYGIVKQSGGNIWVYSEPGKGTIFKIYLPRVDEPLEESKGEVKEEELAQGSETILIVEDNEDVRKLASRVLEKQGYTVWVASQGSDALSLCGEYKKPIHMVLCDVVMPGIGGRELTDHLISLHPEMKVLYMSGYTENAIVHHGILIEGMNYIQKPFTVNGLTRKVREVLNQSRQH
ncbi:MAG: PAS domain S-box protein, partial [Thermodesulfobacteriota bacterium]